jgi:hypothetical protein
VRITDKRRPVGDGFAVRLSFDGTAMEANWSPDVPKGKPHLIPKYQAIRHAFLERVTAELGLSIAVMDV